MELPGGLPSASGLRRDYRFAEVTGDLERAVAESGGNSTALPQQVSLILSTALLEVAGQPADLVLVRNLSVGDRQFLVLQLAALLDPSPRWITVHCGGCGEPIQFQVQPGELPVKPAGAGYPEMTLTLGGSELTLRVPNGADEEYIATRPPGDGELPHTLLTRLLSSGGQPVDSAHFDAADLETLDHLLDEMSPQPALNADIECPHCRLGQQAALDPYAWIVRDTGGLDREIHTLAFYYHWSEREILQLPRFRRTRYLQLIDRSLGKYRADDLIRNAAGGAW